MSYKFSQCNYTCTQVTNLHRHMLTHTEVRLSIATNVLSIHMKKLYQKAFFISGSDIRTQRAHISNYEISLVRLSTENLSCSLSL